MSTETVEPLFLFIAEPKPKRVQKPETRVEKNEEGANIFKFESTYGRRKTGTEMNCRFERNGIRTKALISDQELETNRNNLISDRSYALIPN